MPIPKPNKSESKKDFVQRCMEDNVMVSEYQNTDQRLAVCSTTYEENLSNKTVDKTNTK
jgi:hypothetical protein